MASWLDDDERRAQSAVSHCLGIVKLLRTLVGDFRVEALLLLPVLYFLPLFSETSVVDRDV